MTKFSFENDWLLSEQIFEACKCSLPDSSHKFGSYTWCISKVQFSQVAENIDTLGVFCETITSLEEQPHLFYKWLISCTRHKHFVNCLYLCTVQLCLCIHIRYRCKAASVYYITKETILSVVNGRITLYIAYLYCTFITKSFQVCNFDIPYLSLSFAVLHGTCMQFIRSKVFWIAF